MLMMRGFCWTGFTRRPADADNARCAIPAGPALHGGQLMLMMRSFADDDDDDDDAQLV